MRKKIIISAMTVFVVALVLSNTTISADYPSGTFGYSDAIAVGEEFEWTVTTLSVGGNIFGMPLSSDQFYIGDIILEQGDNIKLVILEDPDTAVGVWYDAYVDGIKVTNPENMDLGYDLYSYGGAGFISPTTYSNATGTYGLYEQLIEELDDYNDGDSYTEIDYGYTYEYSYTESIEFDITSDIFIVKMYTLLYMSINGGGYSEFIQYEIAVEQSINIVSGLLGKTKLWLEYEDSYYGNGHLHLLIESPYTPTPTPTSTPSLDDGTTIVPYVWGFSVFGIITSAIIAIIVRRKRK